MLNAILLSATLFLAPAASPCCSPDAACCKPGAACCEPAVKLTAVEGEKKKEGGCDSCKGGDKAKEGAKEGTKDKTKDAEKSKDKKPN